MRGGRRSASWCGNRASEGRVDRDYDPTTGTFLTPDPLTQGPDSPQLTTGIGYEDGQTTVANPYHYVGNDPLNYTDPLGLCRATDVVFELPGGDASKAFVDDGPEGGWDYEQCANSGLVTCDDPKPVVEGVENFTTGDSNSFCRPNTGGPFAGVPWRDFAEIAGLFFDPIDGGLCVFDAATLDGGNAKYDCLAIIPIGGWLPRGAKWTDEAAQVARGSDDIGQAGVHQFPSIKPRKSQFFDGIDLSALSGRTAGRAGFRQPNGNTRYVLQAGRDIGVDQVTGLPTRIYTVIRGPDGRVVTLYPGTSPKG